MKVLVEYHGQMRAVMGRAREELEVEEGCTMGKIMGERKLKEYRWRQQWKMVGKWGYTHGNEENEGS